MSGPPVTADPRVAPRGRRAPWTWLGQAIIGTGRGLVFLSLILAGLVPLLAVAIFFLLLVSLWRDLLGLTAQGPSLAGIGLPLTLLIFASLLYVRPLTSLTRQLAGQWCGVPIAPPYRQAPDYTGQTLTGHMRLRLRWVATDPSSWRDLLWLPASLLAGSVLVVVPIAITLYGVIFAILPALGVPVRHLPYVGILTARGPGSGLIGIACVLAGLWLAPRLLPAYGHIARAVLGTSRQAELAGRVERLVQARSEYIDTGAAELRRIERDLHDGAQARLVAMGMTLDAIEQQLEVSPEAARALVAEAKASSIRALAELRDLVRGIHPPVLADRGLGEAIRALALDSPRPVRVSLDLRGRPPAPVESAAYFAVNELLANVAKHADAREAWIDVSHCAGLLRVIVSDNGHGGADPAGGTGLHGIERRLSAFDGVLAISSPPGGPTVVNLEIPCALSSPKTSSC
jgi:signal transduction histidine kinase